MCASAPTPASLRYQGPRITESASPAHHTQFRRFKPLVELIQNQGGKLRPGKKPLHAPADITVTLPLMHRDLIPPLKAHLSANQIC